MGREGNHDVIIPDILCSKYHLKFDYDIKQQSYTCVDLGSRNGTILNGQRMSNSKQESDPTKLDHGSVSGNNPVLFIRQSIVDINPHCNRFSQRFQILQIGQTKLLCHMHEGSFTCGQCEPGLVQFDGAASNQIDSVPAASSSGSHLTPVASHKKQLKELKKRYGLQDNSKIDYHQQISALKTNTL